MVAVVLASQSLLMEASLNSTPLVAEPKLPPMSTVWMSFTLEARSPVWYEQWRGEVKDGDLDADEAALRFLAGHIIQPEGVTAEALRTIREHRWREVDEMAKLAVELDGNPMLMALMEPGFLPGASD